MSKDISGEITKTWEQVCMLIIDEISFSTEDQMEKLNAFLILVQWKRSNGNEALSLFVIFGGYLIIFCGDFCQLPPVKVKENQCLYTNCGLRKFYQYCNFLEQWSQIQGSSTVWGNVKANVGRKLYKRRLQQIHQNVLGSQVHCQKLIPMLTYHVGKILKGFQFMHWHFKSILPVFHLLIVMKIYQNTQLS